MIVGGHAEIARRTGVGARDEIEIFAAGVEYRIAGVAQTVGDLRRYALLNPLYIAMVTAQATGLRRFDGSPGTKPEQEMNYG